LRTIQQVNTNKVRDAADAVQSTAFAGLVSPYNVGKINTTVALGHSGSANALALGAGMRINEQFTVKLGGAYDTGTEQVSSYVGAGWEW